MKRWTWRILTCLILGVVTTIGVAWGGSIAHRPEYYVVHRGPDTGPRYSAIAFRNPLSERVWTLPTFPVHTEFDDRMTSSEDELWVWMLLGHEDAKLVPFEFEVPTNLPPLPQHEHANPREFLWVERSGWPLSAMGAAFVCTGSRASVLIRQGGLSLNDLRQARGNHAMLPLRPVFPGFLINTLFYGAIWCVLFLGIGAVRRAVRRRRGWCPQCGYDLRGHLVGQVSDLSPGTSCVQRPDGRDARAPRCPECGWNREGIEDGNAGA